MALTLEQYASQLDARDLPWPSPPPVVVPKARPHRIALPEVRVVLWNLYGTLLNLVSGDLFFTHPTKFVMEVALDKTVQEFKMWGSMSRKPGQPSEYMGQMYERVLSEQALAPSPGEKYPEMHAERVWEALVKKLLQKDYKWDTSAYGALNEYSRKIAYFFHASIQGTACFPGAAETLELLQAKGVRQGLCADAQCFSLVQLERGLAEQHCGQPFDQLFDRSLRALSHEQGGRKPSERLFKPLLHALEAKGIAPAQVLHVGSRIEQDLAPAKKLGMRTALFAGAKESLRATPVQLRDPATRPDILLTELTQLVGCVGT